MNLQRISVSISASLIKNEKKKMIEFIVETNIILPLKASEQICLNKTILHNFLKAE